MWYHTVDGTNHKALKPQRFRLQYLTPVLIENADDSSFSVIASNRESSIFERKKGFNFLISKKIFSTLIHWLMTKCLYPIDIRYFLCFLNVLIMIFNMYVIIWVAEETNNLSSSKVKIVMIAFETICARICQNYMELFLFWYLSLFTRPHFYSCYGGNIVSIMTIKHFYTANYLRRIDQTVQRHSFICAFVIRCLDRTVYILSTLFLFLTTLRVSSLRGLKCTRNRWLT